MIGDMLSKIREDKNVSKTTLAQATNINVGHLTHIEKGERNPSHKALKGLCDALGYNVTNHIKYDVIPMFDNLTGFAKCPKDCSNASICIKVEDDSMSPKFDKDQYVFVELNTPLNNKDFGLFEYDNKYIIRKFIVRKTDLVLRAEKDGIDDIVISPNDNFYIIGRVLGKLEN